VYAETTRIETATEGRYTRSPGVRIARPRATERGYHARVPTRLVVLHVSSPVTWRGGEQQTAYLFAELARKGIEQAIACPPGSVMAQRCAERGWQHVTVRRRASIDPLFARGVARAARALGATIVHAHDPHAHTAAVLASALFAAPGAIVVHRRVDFPIGRGRFTRWKYDHAAVKRIVCVSGAIAEIMRPSLRDPSRLRVVHSGVDLGRFGAKPDGRLRRELAVTDGTALVGNVSALAGHKDYPTFVETAARLLARGVKARFVAVGEGPERPRIEALLKARGLERDVTLAGFRDDVPVILPELDVLLFPSETEGLGTTVLDAFAAGVPVVATRAGGIPEMVVDGECGLLADVKDAETLAGNVARVLSDAALRERLVAGGRARLREFGVDRTAERILAIYREVVGAA
jgi:L-malate glycosyltransferase